MELQSLTAGRATPASGDASYVANRAMLELLRLTVAAIVADTILTPLPKTVDATQSSLSSLLFGQARLPTESLSSRRW